MKRISIVLFVAMLLVNLSSCGNKISLGGESYNSSLVESGYYLDKASLSDAKFVEALSKVKEINRPASLGKVIFPDFSTIELTEQEVVEVTDAMVEAEIEKERSEETTYTPIKSRRNAAMKDKVIIDFKGFQNGVEFEGGAAEDFELVLGSGQFIPGFEEQVAGHAAGKKFNINVTFPENYDPQLAGKPATFEITIKSIEEPTVPEIDNAFVVKHTKGGSFNPEEYREEVKERLAKRNEFITNQNTMYELYNKLYENTKFEPTEEALAWQFSVMMSTYVSQAEQNGSNLSTMIAESGSSVKEFYDEMKSHTPQVVETAMMVDEFKKMYRIKVIDDDAKEWFERLSDAYGYGSQVTYDQYVEYIGKDNLFNTIIEERALAEVAKKCKFVKATEEKTQAS